MNRKTFPVILLLSPEELFKKVLRQKFVKFIIKFPGIRKIFYKRIINFRCYVDNKRINQWSINVFLLNKLNELVVSNKTDLQITIPLMLQKQQPRMLSIDFVMKLIPDNFAAK